MQNHSIEPAVLRDETAVAQFLTVRVKTLQAWRTRGGGPKFIKLGRLVRYHMADVERWIHERRVASTSEKAEARR